MATSTAKTVDAYLAELPADRRAALAAVRDVVNASLPAGYEEGMQFGMPSWYIPLSRYPDTYNGKPLGIAAVASQKNYMALYLMGVYANPMLTIWFKRAFAGAGKKLDMGKSCVRFKTIDALPLPVIGEAIRKIPVDAYLARYELYKGPSKSTSKAKSKPKAKKPAAKKKPAKKR